LSYCLVLRMIMSALDWMVLDDHDPAERMPLLWVISLARAARHGLVVWSEAMR
jgi:hypothetical protein